VLVFRKVTIKVKIRLSSLIFVVLFSLTSAWSQTPRVAILDSANTRHFFELHYAACSPPASYTLGAEEYQRYFRGWEHVLQTNNISYRIFHDADVVNGSLADFDLLILSNTVSLSDDQEKTIAAWVRRGGKLIATFGSGYKDVVTDVHQLDQLKLQKGGTDGLHQLWKDPLSKLFTTLAFVPAVDVQITRYEGPTVGLAGQLNNGVLPYGASGNLLVQRPFDFWRAYAFLMVPGYSKPAPAILSADAAHGRVIYFSFAPEYLVSKEFDLPSAFSCPDGQNWAGRSTQLQILMRDTVLYLLNS
jgi:hypothetical protein